MTSKFASQKACYLFRTHFCCSRGKTVLRGTITLYVEKKLQKKLGLYGLVCWLSLIMYFAPRLE